MNDQRNSRPQPQFGEYADEHENTPADSPATPANDNGDRGAGFERREPAVPNYGEVTKTEGVGSASSRAPQTISATPIPGVPHNLGARSGTPAVHPRPGGPAAGVPEQPEQAAPPQQAARPLHGEPYRASGVPSSPPPVSPEAPPVTQATPSTAGQSSPTQHQGAQADREAATPAQGRRTADRVVTIILLVVGAYGALNSAFALLELRTQVALAAQIFELTDFVVPSQVQTIGTVGAITMLALYALVLIFSIRRLRARKLTFWAPLTAGAVALILMLALSMFAYVQSPELVQAMAQPDAIQLAFDYAEQQGS